MLEIAGVSVRDDGRTLLDDVSLTLAPGTVHVLIGPNGAGKSTLAACILGLRHFSGDITLHLRGNGRIGFVPQSFEADRTLPVTVAELLAASRQRRPVCLGIARPVRARIAELLARVGLAGFEARRLGALSGGELRRVLIANALDPAPELLLCDEPASGLDPEAVLQLDGLIKDAARAGTAVLMVSHDLAEVRRVADQVTWLDRSVRMTGAPDAVLAAHSGAAA
ncbi:MAG: metal ABC transporter ATP-binding protein [Deltaproteobacteria bacterium]|nr:metal ABC transporter ATP-binding protein [Deltaproteobacteria bacterium]